ncbi:MAG: secretin N-terminal domain-containing protein [Candidatus Zixiibacteriota bacterium]
MNLKRLPHTLIILLLTVLLIISCAATNQPKSALNKSPIELINADSLKQQEQSPGAAEHASAKLPEPEGENGPVQDEAEEQAASPARGLGPLVSNVFYETDVRQALVDISAQTGVSIVPGPMVQGYVTVEFEDMPLEQALYQLLLPLGLTFKKMEGYYLVGMASPESPSFPFLSTTELVVPNYIKAANVRKLLSSFYEPFIKVDSETNTLAITASHEMIQRIKQELAKIDVPPRQVMIEALITEFSKEARKSLGLDVGWLGTKDGRELSVIVPLGDLLDSTLGIRYVRPVAEVEGWVGEFKGTLKALVQDGKVNIRANPRVATIEGQKATIMIGKEQYYIIVTGVAPYSYGQLERIPFGVSLNIVPYISDKGEITVEIQPEVSDVVGTGVTGLPVVSKRAVSTKIRVKDGETIVIGGLLQKNESIVKRKIPLLGDIPLLGLLFSRTDKRVDEVETVIFITPHILKEEARSEKSE